MNEQLVDIFKRTFDLNEVDENISRENCEKWDSLNHLNLVVEIETAFKINLEPEEIGDLHNFLSIEKMIQRKITGMDPRASPGR